MKTNNKKFFGWISLILIFVFLSTAACSPAPETVNAAPEVETALTLVEDSPAAAVEPAAETTAEESVTQLVNGLTDVEAQGLLFVREEEKLARDVYLFLYDLWGQSVFNNIANSEQSHTDAIKTLLNVYGLEDPMQSDVPGQFENADLQALYDQLTAQGSVSLEAALRVGAAIEEIDILDIQGYMTQTDKADILQVYQNLASGSENHLRSFVSTLSRRTGTTYEPQYLSSEAYNSIISSSNTNGNSNNSSRGNGNGRRN